jgi:hypothetical protein
LVPYRGGFVGFHAVPASASKTRVMRFDNNKKYAVNILAIVLTDGLPTVEPACVLATVLPPASDSHR